MDQALPVSVTNLVNLAPSPDGSGLMMEVLVHRTPDAQVLVQMVPPGGELTPHHHTGLWDYFVGLAGQATVTLSGDAGTTAYAVGVGGFLAVPPGTMHHVCNQDPEASFVFLLTQAPYSAYDFIVK